MSAQAVGFPDRGPAVFAVTTATLVLASVFVGARMFSRIRIVRHVTPDDYLIAAAWLIAFFLSFTIDFGTRRGLGRHDANIPDEWKTSLRKSEYVFSVLYNPALMATKTSILVFLLRLSKNTNKVLRLASWACLGIVNLAGVVLTLLNIFQCRPIDAAWDPTLDNVAKCIPLLTEFICSAPVNIVTDLVILTLPIPVLTGMQLPPRQKFILVFTFTLGIFVTVVDVVRIYYLQQAIMYAPMAESSNPLAIFGDRSEFAWNASMSLMWSAVEVNVGIICACIPTLKPLIIRILPAMLYDPHGTRSKTSSATLDSRTLDLTPAEEVPDNTQLPQGEPLTSPQLPPPVVAQGNRDPEEMSVREFLAGGPRQRGGLAARLGTSTMASGRARSESAVFFGFVNMKKPTSMLRTSASDSWKYCTAVTILFFLWGFSYGLLNTLNNAVAAVANMSEAQTLGLTSIYFGGGYFFGPLLVGEWLIRHDEHHRSKGKNRDLSDNIGGFRITFIVGLLIYGTGTMAFWPSAVLHAFGGFMVSNFIVGFGLGVLETAANPFLALCGPMQYSEMRLLLAQGVQAVGSVLSGLLAQNVYFVDVDETGYSPLSLLDVQWTYLAITLSCVLLALFFYYMPLPEVSDNELQRLADRLPVNPKKKSIGGLSLRTWSIILAVMAQWTCIAAQESMSLYFGALLTQLHPVVEASDRADQRTDQSASTDRPTGLTLTINQYLLIAHTAFAVSRFVCGYIAYLSVKHPRSALIPTPRTMLTVAATLTFVFSLLVVLLKPRANANLLVISIVLFFLAEGPLWPLIFALGLRGQGKRTKRAGAWLTMGASGPAFWPFVVYAIVKGGGSLQTAFIVVVVLVGVTVLYPLFLTFVKDARVLVDPGMGGSVNVDDSAPDEDINGMVASRRRASAAAGKRESTFGRFSRGFSSKKRNSVTPPPVVEYREDSGQRRPDEGHAEEHGQRAPWEDQALDTRILEEP